MAVKRTKVKKTELNYDVMTDGLHSYQKQSNGTYLQVGSSTKRTIQSWNASGFRLVPTTKIVEETVPTSFDSSKDKVKDFGVMPEVK